jgi:perosamine synthetase
MNDFLLKPWPQPAKIDVPLSMPDLSDSERTNLLEVFDSGWIGSGAKIIPDLEELFCAHLGVQHAQLVSNGSVALMLALRSLDIGPGDEVIVPSLTYAATASSVVNVGADPVFCDVSLESWQITLDDIVGAITAKTKAVIVPHIYGMPADIKPILEFCRASGIFVIEDAAEALGALYGGINVGTIADIGTYSFFPNKLITSGEGGLCVTNNSELNARMKLLKSQGMSSQLRYVFEEPGYNFRISGIQAAVLQSQLQRFDELFSRRWDSEETWRKSLKSFREPEAGYDYVRAPWIFSLRVPGISHRTKRLITEELASRGIETRPVFYPLPLMPGFSRFRSHGETRAAIISDESLSLPTGKHVPEATYEIVASVIDNHSMGDE